MARILFGPTMSVQAPPNLSPGVLPQIVAAGINDWGGVSPLTPDFVNPEAPWPHLDDLARESRAAGKFLHERLTIYPSYAQDLNTWVDSSLHEALLTITDTDGFPRTDDWSPGETIEPPAAILDAIGQPAEIVSADIISILDKAASQELLTEADVVRLFTARGDDFNAVVQEIGRASCRERV